MHAQQAASDARVPERGRGGPSAPSRRARPPGRQPPGADPNRSGRRHTARTATQRGHRPAHA
eukprot:11480541-Alexandrium_andersonii.AAC.1